MKKTKVKAITNGSSLKNMQKMLKEMLGPQENNRHIFLDKIFKIQRQLLEINKLYQTSQKSLGVTKDQITSIFTDSDWEYMTKINKLYTDIKQELTARLTSENRLEGELNVLDFMISQYVKSISPQEIQDLSDFVNGFKKDSVVQRVIEFYSEQTRQFGALIQKQGVYQLQELQSAFVDCTENKQSLKIFDLDIWKQVAEARYNDDKVFLEKVIFIIKLLSQQSSKLYSLMIIPEMDVMQMKELIEMAIKEFKKQVQGCDLAFQKLLKSLDTFVQNFDRYYEKFLVEGKDPMMFFFEFIEDVKKQYEDTDQKGCREVLRQFKNIQLEFGKKITKNMSNPYVKDLYDQLCEQMDRAGKIINMDSSDF